MFPPSQSLRLDIDAISGIFGSISIACWVVVFSPQIIENFRRSSAEGLSIVFLVIWLAGDVFNILGAVLQGVLPTMIILAVYYTLADVVLIAQCFYYRGLTLSDSVRKPDDTEREGASAGETAPLLTSNGNAVDDGSPVNGRASGSASPGDTRDTARRLSASSFRERLLSLDGTHLSPVTPLHGEARDMQQAPAQGPATTSALKRTLLNLTAILLVCAAGTFGWWLSERPGRDHGHRRSEGKEGEGAGSGLAFNIWGQVFGYICAFLYLGSRVPQLLLNYRRKSTEGISMLFFLFACVGNLTYVLSIMAYAPLCSKSGGGCGEGEAGREYGTYVAVNLSWLLGSFGTLLLDLGVFVQFFLYKDEDEVGS